MRKFTLAKYDMRVVTVMATKVTACHPNDAGCMVRIIEEGKWRQVIDATVGLTPRSVSADGVHLSFLC